MPPLRCASATTCIASVDLPEDSGPKISTTRPRGKPPTPRARSRGRAPVGMASIAIEPFSPIRMMEPFPYCLSIWASAASSALSRSGVGVLMVCAFRMHPQRLLWMTDCMQWVCSNNNTVTTNRCSVKYLLSAPCAPQSPLSGSPIIWAEQIGP